ncbi:hypothetical protein GLOIN_2v1772781 [Rhizophagus clarus]|uniref:Myb/SANT-like DNA-binding domain-containing protein n=1 Tax=Rhizophagus clarus TaxID=94130 RepID=A0A8H3KVQ2_9GLOM|nr:hypothetical protein GLOIN_2v1772781 [Rhizophagus clarus]
MDSNSVSNFQYDSEFCVQQIPYLFNHFLNHQPVEYSFFYSLLNETYHIKCEEINNIPYNLKNNSFQYDNVYSFDYEQPDNKRVYRFTCRNLSSTFNFQFLNKFIYGMEFTQIKQQKSFPTKDQVILESNLKKILTYYSTLDQTYEKNYFSDLMFIEDYQNYYTCLSKSSNSDENKKNSEKKSSRCMWNENSVRLLLSFLIEHKKKVAKIAKTRQHGGNKIKTKLWNDAVAMLSKNGYKYTAKQCSIKWKNIKSDYNDDSNQNGNNVRYKLEVEEILNRNT